VNPYQIRIQTGKRDRLLLLIIPGVPHTKPSSQQYREVTESLSR